MCRCKALGAKIYSLRSIVSVTGLVQLAFYRKPNITKGIHNFADKISMHHRSGICEDIFGI